MVVYKNKRYIYPDPDYIVDVNTKIAATANPGKEAAFPTEALYHANWLAREKMLSGGNAGVVAQEIAGYNITGAADSDIFSHIDTIRAAYSVPEYPWPNSVPGSNIGTNESRLISRTASIQCHRAIGAGYGMTSLMTGNTLTPRYTVAGGNKYYSFIAIPGGYYGQWEESWFNTSGYNTSIGRMYFGLASSFYSDISDGRNSQYILIVNPDFVGSWYWGEFYANYWPYYGGEIECTGSLEYIGDINIDGMSAESLYNTTGSSVISINRDSAGIKSFYDITQYINQPAVNRHIFCIGTIGTSPTEIPPDAVTYMAYATMQIGLEVSSTEAMSDKLGSSILLEFPNEVAP